MRELESYSFPDDIKKMNLKQLNNLSKEIREFLISNVAKTGGHLGPNLGVVELTLGLFKVYDVNKDSFIYDVGHQTYIHKILTGRTNFEQLRQKDGLSGYPSRKEHAADILENSHASVSLSWADGISRANILKKDDSTTIAVVGDGSLSGGMIWEAINHISYSMDQKLIIIVNDNGRSYAQTVGGLAHHLSSITNTKTYFDAKLQTKKTLEKMGNFGRIVSKVVHNFKTGIKTSVVPVRIFSDFDIEYIGPINGHSLEEVIGALESASRCAEPVIIHAITQKGHGYKVAEAHKKDQYHAVGQFDPETGELEKKHSPCWSHIMGRKLTKLAKKNDKIVAISAAMLDPVGLEDFAKSFPERCFDVGIAEAHAVGFASGFSYKGYHSVFAVYSSFANRAFDQLLFDASLHNEALTLCLDRAGATGDDGPTHNGIWDISLFSKIPNIKMSAPWDKDSLEKALEQALKIEDRITTIRYPKADVLSPLEIVKADGDILYFAKSQKKTNLIIALGPILHNAVAAAKQSKNTTVISSIWFYPIADRILKEASKYENIIIAEDGISKGGFGESFLREFNEQHQNQKFTKKQKITLLGIKSGFQKVNTRDSILSENALDKDGISRHLK
ncbi:MAG: 1-deoxy-D-xylulose-5-phosphate synthase [Bifidobacteriaceae bacterium]|jgi:1-deoxy-D-xylulose-5-phosphate synthase|nr:1-deoxy-D-xylulose-5-phosphate synthase [Bifidobacteriaceae bacterium]